MKKWRIEYRVEYTPSPLSFWVHKHLDSEVWSNATKFDPPLPRSIPCKGFPVLVINALGVELEFSSIEEAEHFLDIISKKNMPTSLQLSNLRGGSYGPNGHWLSRLPARLKPWVKREKIIPIIKGGIREFKLSPV
ncbi:hypothetical protein [Agarivorans sp. QJM3NY_25]|uniref:hypothetical protein n=1 Tax=Agarivorans sp. QJM3NY_25 TaxID=3421430 RepID=UPI003D7EAB54